MKLLYGLSVLLLSTLSYAEAPTIVGHRGASHDAPENTLPAFNLAWQQGADAIEGDFYLTQDGHIVCIHDRNTKKVANRNLTVSESTLAELRTLDVGAWKDPAFTGTQIPTIAEVFSTLPDQKKIFVEIKCGPEIIPALLKAIDQSGLRAEQVVVICFKEGVLKELKKKAPHLYTSWLSSFKKDKQTGDINPSLERVLDTLKAIGADGFSSSKDMPEPYVKALQARGYDWHVWTVNDLKQAQRMESLGVHSISTDLPGYLKKNLFVPDTVN